MSIDASIVLPATVPNALCYAVVRTALETLRETTDAPCLLLLNNSTQPDYRRMTEKLAERLSITVKYMQGPFSMSKSFNFGTTMTLGKYIVYATSDVVFFPHWLDNLIALWEREPHYFILCPASWNHANYGIGMNENVRFEQRIERTHNPNSGGLYVLKRVDGYRFDENFSMWEMDADLVYYLEHNGLAAGICFGSRVDHYVNGICGHIDPTKHFAPLPDPSIYLRKKWKLPSPIELSQQ